MSFFSLSIKARLTAWYTVVLMFILIAISVAIYLFAENRLESMVREKLDAGYGVVESVILNSGGDIFDVVHLGHDNPFQLFQKDTTAYVTRAWIETGLPSPPDREKFEPYGSVTIEDGRQ